MQRFLRLGVAVGAVSLVLGGTAAGGTARLGKAHLVVVDQTPLIVQGSGFAPSARVRLAATTTAGRAVRTVVTSLRGTLRVRFPTISLPGCAMFSIRATSAAGTLVVLRIVPECANGPAP